MSTEHEQRAGVVQHSTLPQPDGESAVGHGTPFVRPSDLLRPRTASKPDRPIDRDERAGLVSGTLHNAERAHVIPTRSTSH